MTRARSLAVSMVALTAIVACGPAQDTATSVELALPQALLACASPPELSARLWVSGSKQPCALDVDVAAGTTTGSCDVTPGIKRTLTLDWFTTVDHGGDFTLLLAQARGSVDLSTPSEQADFKVKDDDVKTDACLDMTGDSQRGAEVVVVDGAEVPPCDVDESCNGADGACTNLGELCAGADPFNDAVEP